MDMISTDRPHILADQTKSFDDHTKAGVKGLVDAGMTTNPSKFIHPKDDQGISSPSAPRGTFNVPVIDLTGVEDNANGRKRIIDELQNQVSSVLNDSHSSSSAKCDTTLSDTHSQTSTLADLDWDNLGFGVIPTDHMYMMKCAIGEGFSKGELRRYGNIEMSPSAGVLNYGQGLFEGLKAYRTQEGSIVLFRPEENALRMITGAERMCMPAPTVEQFVEAVKETVLANERWIPPAGKGSLYIRPLLMGSGSVLGIAPAPEYTLLIYTSPVGNYFKEGLAPINLVIENDIHRATPGGTGGVKTIGNYAAVLKALTAAKAKGYSDVLYLDCVHKKYLEEVSACNVFVVKGNVITTPAIRGTILPGITRKSIIDIAQSQGFEVVEQLVSIEELLDADEVFCTGTAVVVSPVGSITHMDKRTSFADGNVGKVTQQLYTSLTRLQMGLAEDKMGWIVKLK